MSAKLREQIIMHLKKRREEGTLLVQDEEIAQALDKPLSDIRDQLEILASQGLVKLTTAVGPKHAAELTARGMLAAEELQGPTEPKKPPLGFPTN